MHGTLIRMRSGRYWAARENLTETEAAVGIAKENGSLFATLHNDRGEAFKIVVDQIESIRRDT